MAATWRSSRIAVGAGSYGSLIWKPVEYGRYVPQALCGYPRGPDGWTGPELTKPPDQECQCVLPPGLLLCLRFRSLLPRAAASLRPTRRLQLPPTPRATGPGLVRGRIP